MVPGTQVLNKSYLLALTAPVTYPAAFSLDSLGQLLF